MIIYKDILEQLRDAGYSAYRLRKEKLLSEATIQRLREGSPVSTATIDVVCDLLGCGVADILEHRPTPQNRADNEESS